MDEKCQVQTFLMSFDVTSSRSSGSMAMQEGQEDGAGLLGWVSCGTWFDGEIAG
jgi:hypothetical protein